MRRKIFFSIAALSAFLLAALLGGCGSANKEGAVDPTATAVRIDNSNCTNACHAAAISPVTGNNIVFEWLSSAHQKTNGELVDCQSCHGGGSLHWGVGPIPHPNPDNDGVCSAATCHDSLGFPHIPRLTPAILASATIWDNMSSAGYVTSQNTGKCRTCHNPHNNTVLQQNRDWANSGHGDKYAAPWIHYDFKARTDCNRCHTTTGYIKYVTSGDKTAWAVANSTDKTKEVLRCDGCHENYSWKLRSLGPVLADYTNVPDFFYPDAKNSNICLNCHIGRENGDSVKNATGDFSNRNFINSHYLTAGATLYAQSGYEYAGRYYVDNIAHRTIGISSVPLGNTTSGPCAGCHMKETDPALASRHSFLNVARDATGTMTAILSPICVICHSFAGIPIGYFPQDATGVANLSTVEGNFEAALEALKQQLIVRGYFFQNTNPYFFTTATGNTRVTNWLSPGDTDTTGNTTGKNNMGAAFNYNLLFHDPGAYAHDPIYTRRLIYDAIDWLDDNLLNDSVLTAINNLATAGAIDAATQANATAYLIPRL